jgi:hypothetical protein
MGREFGRISGPLLADNLLRNGNNLVFDTQVLYLDVVNKRIGANNVAPATDLYTPTAISSTNIIATGTSTLGNFSINSTGTVQNASNSIGFNYPISTTGLGTSAGGTTQLYLYGNTISNVKSNDTINITANGTGAINFANGNGNVQVTVNGALHATGNITFDGNITLGTNTSNTITFAAEVNSNILPITSGSYSLGSTTNLWNTIYTSAITVSSTTIPTTSAGTLNAGNFSITGTTITNTSSNNNFNITPNGTGTVQVNGTVLFATLQGNNIPNTSSAPYIMANTGAGYYKFGTTSGLSIPSGSTVQRPGYTEIGMIRYNTDVSYGEVYNGNAWIPIGGISASLTLDQVTSIMLTNVIVFGR